MELTELQAKVDELEAEINNLRACIKCEKLPEGYDVNDDATTELAIELAKSQHETGCYARALDRILWAAIEEDVVACYEIAEKALGAGKKGASDE